MNSLRRIARIWPSAAALGQDASIQAAQAPGGLHLAGPNHTFDNLLPRLLDETPLPQGRQLLAPLAGPLLVGEILRALPDPGPWSGLAAGRRPPAGLWRLLVEIKAAGLNARQIRKAFPTGRERLHQLARLLAAYEESLAGLGLADEADGASALENMLAKGGRPGLMSDWQAVRAEGVLWLRTLDFRLLRALARALPVRVEFCLAPPMGAAQPLVNLLQASAQVLERGDTGIEVAWADPLAEGGPLADLALAGLGGSGPGAVPQSERLSLVRGAGRYPEVEALVLRAAQAMRTGAPANELALVFPDLAVYGQMAVDAAARLGVPLSASEAQSLGQTPLAQAMLGLLELPLAGYPREELIAAWESPYVGPALARLALGPAGRVPPGLGRILRQSGYVDGRETPAWALLERLLERDPKRRDADQINRAKTLLTESKAVFARLSQARDVRDYFGAVAELLRGLAADTRTPIAPDLATAGLLARDLAAARGLTHTLESLSQAAAQIQATGQASGRRLWALLRQSLETAPLDMRGGGGGVRLLRLDQAAGFRAHTLLAGGLAQGGFPQRPPAGRHLSSADRFDLGKLARMPVWRTDQEEYGGQVLRLLMLLAQAREGAMLACPAADASGVETEPSLIFKQLAERAKEKISQPTGGVFGGVDSLGDCQEPAGLWQGLSRALLRPRAPIAEREQAAATLWELNSRDESAGVRWQGVAARALVEARRQEWDLLGAEQRLAVADAHGGRLGRAEALALLGAILAQPKQRKLSPSRIETIAACPQAWFLGRVMRLEPWEEAGWDLEPMDEGDWVHDTLSRFFAPTEFDPGWDAAQRLARLEACLDAARDALAQGGKAGHARVWEARRDALLAALARVVEGEWPLFEAAKPYAVETWLGGPEGEGLRLDLPQGDPLFITGRLDRLDVGPELLRVTDYKHSRNEAMIREHLKPELAGAARFQLPVYLAGALTDLERKPAELQARIKSTRLADKQYPPLEYQAGDGFLALEASARVELLAKGEPNLFNHIIALWQGVSRGLLVPRPDKAQCQYCDFGDICRAKVVIGAGEGEGDA